MKRIQTRRRIAATGVALLGIGMPAVVMAQQPADRGSSQAYPISSGSGQMPQTPGAGEGAPSAAAPGQPGAAGQMGQAPQVPGAETTTPPGTTTPTTPPSDTGAAPTEPTGALAAGTGGGLAGATGAFYMLGDQFGLIYNGRVPVSLQPSLVPMIRLHQAQVGQAQRPPIPGQPQPGQGAGAVPIPSVRAIKIAENQSPQPQDRFYMSFDYFNDLNSTIDRHAGAFVNNLRAYREIFGIEKTFWDKSASIGLRLPVNSLAADSPIRGLGGTTTTFGDLAVILKYAFYQNLQTGDVFSGGLLVSTPTGSARFAGAPGITGLHYAALQPYVGFLRYFGNAYVQGFSSIDVPVNSKDVTIWYNDVGVGYYLYKNFEEGRLLTAIAPTAEVHVNTPLNHRNFNNFSDPAGTPDVVDFTFGTNFGLGRRGLFGAGFVTPVTGPKPFHYQWLFQFNLRF